MYQLLAALLLSVSLTGCAGVPIPGFAAQEATEAKDAKQPTVSDVNDVWEYLVVSRGKVYFYDESKKQPSSKPFSSEATPTQEALDVLGKEGWELVTVVGVIGGDQEFILKRRQPKSTPVENQVPTVAPGEK